MNLDDIETVSASRGSVQRIVVKSVEEADELPSKTAVTTASEAVTPGVVTATSFSYPTYRDRVSWLAVIYKSVPNAVGLAGIKYAFNSAEVRWRRLMWTILVLAGMAVCGYQIVERSIHFASTPKSLDVSISEVSSIAFPTIAICNYNKFRASAVNGTPFGDFLTDGYLHPHTLDYSKYYDTLSTQNYKDLAFNFSHQLEDSILGVSWNKLPLYPALANFTLKMTDWGPCFIFNDADNGLDGVVITASGRALAGLEVTIDVQLDEYFYDPWTVLSGGLHVAVYPHGTEPFMEDVGFSVAPGTSTLVGMDLVENVYLGPPFGECENKTLKYFDYYGSLECTLECAGDFIAARCGCKPLNMPGDVPDCNAWEFYTCVSAAFGEYLVNSTCDCPLPCATRNYVATMSQAAFPAPFYSVPVASMYNTTPEYVRENLCRLHFYFNEMNVVTTTQQQDYTFFSLLCDIGGSLGLWLGGSILTLFEIIDLFGHATYIYSRNAPKIK